VPSVRETLKRVLDELQARPRDVQLLMKAGELCQKMNENQRAAEFFGRVANEYAFDGYFLKAIAVFKQVARLDPERPEINVRLADLHFQLKLATEGRAYLKAALDGFTRLGRHAEARTARERLEAFDHDLQNPKAKA
jgi:pilus assembly protein FimV